MTPLLAPFPYFGGKRSVTDLIWARLGRPRQYIEPFCGSAAVLFGAPSTASLEVINDWNGFIANFWRAIKYDFMAVVHAADYPISHIDMGARHKWLMAQRGRLGVELQDPNWPGDAKVAGWWLWGQCSWIGSGWCDWGKEGLAVEPQSEVQAEGPIPLLGNAGRGIQAIGQIPYLSGPGMGVQAVGKVPLLGNAGRGVQAIGKIPQISDPGRGVQAIGQIPQISDPGRGVQALSRIPETEAESEILTSGGRTAKVWLKQLADRLERVRVTHGDWHRCLNHHYGGEDGTAVFLDPPYRAYEGLYGSGAVADEVEKWAFENPKTRVVLCGHLGDYPTLSDWDCVQWKRPGATYSGKKTTDKEAMWFSPACEPAWNLGDAFEGMFSSDDPDESLLEDE